MPVKPWVMLPRIIPAHAGSTRTCFWPGVPSRDHPRSRGEHVFTSALGRQIPGSSPLTRGARSARTDLGPRRRIIPAHAGSTRSAFRLLPCTRDHPRSRGEHIRGRNRHRQVAGSSPLTRGALTEFHFGQFRAGIIPAHAGSTYRSVPTISLIRDHPRSRGEHWPLLS